MYAEQILLLTHHLPSGLNGQVCKVKGPKDADRFDVQLVDGSIKAVKTGSLRVLAEPGSLVKPSNVEQVSRQQMLGKGSGNLESFKIGINYLGLKKCLRRFANFKYTLVHWYSSSHNQGSGNRVPRRLVSFKLG